jgi:hypothetical protein
VSRAGGDTTRRTGLALWERAADVETIEILVLSRLARDGRADPTARVESGELSVPAALRLVPATQSQPL